MKRANFTAALLALLPSLCFAQAAGPTVLTPKLHITGNLTVDGNFSLGGSCVGCGTVLGYAVVSGTTVHASRPGWTSTVDPANGLTTVKTDIEVPGGDVSSWVGLLTVQASSDCDHGILEFMTDLTDPDHPLLLVNVTTFGFFDVGAELCPFYVAVVGPTS